MKRIFQLAAACMAAAAAAQTTATPRESLMHVSTSIHLVVHAPYAETAPLFGPEGERAWVGPHWDPQFIYPQPARDVEGAVFTVRHGSVTGVWTNTLFDVDARHFQYVCFLPDLMVTTIDVRFKPMDSNTTAVNLVFTRTAITTEGNDAVKALSERDRNAEKDFAHSIDKYLTGRKASARP